MTHGGLFSNNCTLVPNVSFEYVCLYQWLYEYTVLGVISHVHYWRWIPGRVLPYLGKVGKFCGEDPSFYEIFYLIGSLFYASSRSDWPLSTAKNWFVSITFTIFLEILGPKVGLIFYQNVFKILSILYQFSHWFSIQLTPFFNDLRFFWPLILLNLRSDWVQFFIGWWTQLPKIVKYPLSREMKSFKCAWHYTCAHTHIYIYIYMYIFSWEICTNIRKHTKETVCL